MATNPYYTQLHTQRFSFIGSPQQRSGSNNKDQRFINMYPELIKSPISDGKKYYLKKRPGLSTFNSGLPNGISQGIFYWAANQSFYYVIDGVLYVNNGTLIGNFTSANVQVGFCEFRSDTTDQLFMCDGTNAWVMGTTNSRALITDPNLPKPHVPAPIFLDGYIFLAKAGTQTIYNSQLQDPTTWPADGFIDAEMYPDNIQTLAKVQNYIAAVGQYSVEWFYDNANSTGSPLQRNAPAVSQFGTPAAATVNQTEKELILVGQTGNGGRTVWVIDGFQPKEIANEPVREALDLEGTNIVGASAFTCQVAGHKFYVLNLIGARRTFVYDFEEQMWHEWQTGPNNNLFNYRWCADSGNGVPVLMNYNSTGTSVFLDTSSYSDITDFVYCTVITTKIDMDTIDRKRVYRLSLITDAPQNGVNTLINVSWSDDDYNTFSTPKAMLINGTYPTVTQLGYMRRRAFRFDYFWTAELRMESFELDYTQEVRR